MCVRLCESIGHADVHAVMHAKIHAQKLRATNNINEHVVGHLQWYLDKAIVFYSY